MKLGKLLWCCIFASALSLSAQGLKTGSFILTGEIEFTQDQQGNQVYDNYWFGHNSSIELLGRFVFVKNGVERFEGAFGKAWIVCKNAEGAPRLVLIPYGGITTDGAVFTPVVVAFSFLGHSGHYLVDPKFYLRVGSPNTAYQETSIGITKDGRWQARAERLRIAGGIIAFNRLGFERRFWTRNKISGENSHFHISPFVDTANRSIGFYTGFRWE